MKMKPDHSASGDIPKLRQLWKLAFGDTDAFLDVFFSVAFAPDRCRCIREGDVLPAALYWMDMTCQGQKFAYIYAVATDPAFRGKGLCRLLMEDTAEVLTARGYDGAILVPQDEGLRTMYGRMGYLPATAIEAGICAASAPCVVTEITAEEYAARRIPLLPEGSILPGQDALDFLAEWARFYAGDGFLAAVSRELERLRILEYLGDAEAASALVAALNATEATLRKPGTGVEFSMYRPLKESCKKPEYYPFAFD
jgi:GNAT superfamily N-acetyltransferase